MEHPFNKMPMKAFSFLACMLLCAVRKMNSSLVLHVEYKLKL